MAKSEILLRLTCIAGTALLLTGCDTGQPKTIQKTPLVRETPPAQDLTQEVLSKIHQEVRRLAQTYPEDSIVRKVYLSNLSDISPAFKGTLPVGIADPTVTYSRVHFAQAEYTPVQRFSYFLYRDQSRKDYPTLREQKVAFYFSPQWLNSKNDRVKTLALEKEAYTLALWEPFTRIALNTYLSQGRVEKLDPTVTEQEIARTLARNMVIDDANVQKLYDYAGYLMVLPQIGQLLALADPQITAELNYSNLATIYELARKQNIPFENLEFASADFLHLAFAANSPWNTMILNPTIPGPAIIR